MNTHLDPIRPAAVLATERIRPDADHGHGVRFYEDDRIFLDELSRVIGSALGAGDAAIVVATAEHREGLIRQLNMYGLDVADLAADGRFVCLDAAETLAKFEHQGLLDAALFADLLGGIIARTAATALGESPRIAVFGEMVALLWARGEPEATIQLERLWNDLGRTHSFRLHCAYPLSAFAQAGDHAFMEAICAAHSSVAPAESYTSLIGEDERLRAVTLLQQKAHALETEIEERNKAQQSLRERNRELRAAIAVRDQFMSTAAHELKTPVTSLRAFAQLLLRDARRRRAVTPERLESALNALELQTGKLQGLVERLLDTTQIEAGKLRIEPIETDLVALIHSVLAPHQGASTHRFVFAGPERLTAEVDPVRFGQVIANLLDNAVKFSPENGTITITLEENAEGIRLSVTYHGVGIPPDQRTAVFGRFHQAHNAHHLSGMGLGLYITREIIELHGGFARIEEPEHPGSRFVVGLPPATGPKGARESHGASPTS
jgi:signal transduction histidine kinase